MPGKKNIVPRRTHLGCVPTLGRYCAGSEYDDAGRQYGCWFAPGMSVCLGVVVYNGLVDDRPIGVKVMKAVLQSMCFVELLFGNNTQCVIMLQIKNCSLYGKTYFVFIGDFSQYTTGASGCYDTRRNVMGYDTSCSDDGIIIDGNST